MSLFIDVWKVTEVLIGSEWYPVKPKSFLIDAYEYDQGEYNTVSFGGSSGITYQGFTFVHADSGVEHCGPMTSVKAVRTDRPGNVFDDDDV